MSEVAPRPIEAIAVLPIAAPSSRISEAVTAELSRRVRLPCRLEAAPPGFEMPHLVGRNQADADGLLARLEELDRPVGEVVIGLTREDLGHPIFTHFFGRARHGGTAALVSTARLAPPFYGLPQDVDLTVERTVLEVIHELGHVVGLGHCDDFGCLMRFASNVEAIDNRGKTFCEACLPDVPVDLLR